jgi:hypothetical protein
MTRRQSRALIIYLAIALVAAGMPSPAAADKPPRRLWDEFPLDPTPTASRAAGGTPTREATPAPTAAPRPAPGDAGGGSGAPGGDAGGGSGAPAGVVIALVVAAAGIGAISGVVVTRRLRADRKREVAATVSGPPARPPTVAAGSAAGGPPAAAAGILPAAGAASSGAAAHGTPGTGRFERAAERDARTSSPAETSVPGPLETAEGAWEVCEIRFHNRAVRAHFYAVAGDGARVIARSPYFRVGRAGDEPGISAPAALEALVGELSAAGWRQTAVGRVPWDLEFGRSAARPHAASSERT